ncbi:MAG: SH3 domain-containing protein [Thermomicrobiales bacterium]|nr:SH3 domain-containing protein [Thermomicrobiales bacterium]
MTMPDRRARWRASIVLITLILSIAPWGAVRPLPVSADTNLTLGGEARVSYANGDQVRLRDEPSYNGNVLTSVPEGWLVAVHDGPIDDGAGSSWYEVTARGMRGYMVSDFLADAGSAQTGEGEVTAAAEMRTTANLRLRSGASLDASVLLVIPSGATVNTTGATQNGFAQLTYQGTTGWASTQYLTSSGSTSGAAMWVNVNGLNLRSSASTSGGVLLVMPRGAQVSVTGNAQSGFTPVQYNGTSGWAYTEYLTSTNPGSSATATPGAVISNAWVTGGALNLRSGPSTSNSVILVMPNNAQVGVTGTAQNGFTPVRYNGANGWAYSQYLTSSGAGATSTPDGGLVLETRYTTAGLNLRSGPSTTSTVLLVIPSGAAVSITGSQTNGFFPVRYSGTNGYASASYLTTSGSSNPTSTPGSGNTGGGIVWPVQGSTWEITQGYNGSSHVNSGSLSQYLYSLDIARADRATAGQQVYAPVSGTVRWTERASGGITINMGNGYAVAMFHVTVDRSWEMGDTIQQGQYIGYISGPGGEGFVQFAHLHLTVWATNDGGNWDRTAVPFIGQNAISGQEFPNIGGTQQWTGTLFNP